MNKYYVYTLAYPDGRVFYVGKGKRARVQAHEREADKHYGTGRSKSYICHCRKCRIIRDIWERHGDVVQAIAFETSDEQLAYSYEKSLIAQYASHELCNIMPGNPNISTVALEVRNTFYESERQKAETGRRAPGTGSIYQNSAGRWCAMLSRGVGEYRQRKKFEAKTRDSAAAKMLRFLEQNQADGWG